MVLCAATMRPLFPSTLATSWLAANEGEAKAENRTAARASFVLMVMFSLLCGKCCRGQVDAVRKYCFRSPPPFDLNIVQHAMIRCYPDRVSLANHNVSPNRAPQIHLRVRAA